MDSVGVRFVFDYVDPGSYLLFHVLEGAGEEPGRDGRPPVDPAAHPFEMRPPPHPVIDPEDPRWVELYRAMEAEAEALGIPLELPSLVPWSRKAHELALQAGEKGCFPEVHASLFRAYFVEGRDIGRVDALVEIAADHGLDRSETRAALDVDRQRETLEKRRREALDWGIQGVPTLLLPDGRRLEGFRKPGEVRAFLDAAATDQEAGDPREPGSAPGTS